MEASVDNRETQSSRWKCRNVCTLLKNEIRIYRQKDGNDGNE
jgi:hypothetical protein